jgi:hypothetical protein
MNVLDSILQSNLQQAQTVQTPSQNGKKAKNKKVMATSIAGSAVGIVGAVAGVYSLAKHSNPAVTLKNLSYEEKDVLMIGAGSVLGGLAGGLIGDDDKKNVKPKLREASQQFFGNMACPIGLLALSNKILDKTNFQLPKIASNNKAAQVVNGVISVLPKVVTTVASLVCGMEIGNKIMNKVNDKVFKEEIKHDVHAEDYLVHADDLCLAANMLLKDAKSVSVVTNKVLPATFIVAGSKTGMAKVEE